MSQSCKISLGDFSEVVRVQIPKQKKKNKWFETGLDVTAHDAKAAFVVNGDLRVRDVERTRWRSSATSGPLHLSKSVFD